MKFEQVLVIGAGTMGRGIAQWFLQQGHQVTLTDSQAEMRLKSKDLIEESFKGLVSKNKLTDGEAKSALQRLKLLSPEELNQNIDLAIECIIENFQAKVDLFLWLDKKLKKDCLFTSNTSSISISKMGKHLPIDRQKNFLGLHFFNPATIMKLVEVIESSSSAKEKAESLLSFFKEKGKAPVLCKDSPGFIVNRVARNFYGEAFRIAKSENQKRYKEIDRVMSEVGGFKMGPFELMDLIGIDVNLDVTTSVWQDFYCEPRFAPHLLQKKMVDSGRLGKKTKRGFYDYE
jgi:3-hydroxybutyryl-CoA dehydrogenase